MGFVLFFICNHKKEGKIDINVDIFMYLDIFFEADFGIINSGWTGKQNILHSSFLGVRGRSFPWCREQDLSLHGLLQQILSLA